MTPSASTLPSLACSKAHIMVAGMKTMSIKAGFVSMVLSAGDNVAAALRAKVAEIQPNIAACIGLTLNALYINQRPFALQRPL